MSSTGMTLKELLVGGDDDDDDVDGVDGFDEDAHVEMYIGSDSIAFPPITPMKVEEMEADPLKRRK